MGASEAYAVTNPPGSYMMIQAQNKRKRNKKGV